MTKADPSTHLPRCVEDDHDRRGDCNGMMTHLLFHVYRCSLVPHETGWMCEVHAELAILKGEVTKTRPAPSVTSQVDPFALLT